MKDMRPDRDPRELSELLRRVVPDSPDPAGRADQVVRRARRSTRRRGTASATAVAVVALSVIVGPHLLPSSPVSNDAIAPTVPTQSDLPGPGLSPFTCASAGHPLTKASSISTGKVPAGAVLARICDGGGSGTVPWQAPLDALTTNVDAVAEAFNSAPVARPIPCPPPMNVYGFTITFQYSDGRLARLTGVSDACDFASLHGTPGLGRSAAGQVMTAYFTELRRQRAHETPPAPASLAPVGCPRTPDPDPVGLVAASPDRLDLTQGNICHYPGLLSRTRAFFVLTPSQLSRVNADYASRATSTFPHISCSFGPSDPIDLVGHNAWGDRIWLTLGCHVFQQSHGYWLPSPSIMTMLDRVLSGKGR